MFVSIACCLLCFGSSVFRFVMYGVVVVVFIVCLDYVELMIFRVDGFCVCCVCWCVNCVLYAVVVCCACCDVMFL